MPGYWAWDEDRKDFIWVSGFWRNVPPGRTWVPGSWRKTKDGWQWAGGLWAGATPDGKAEVEYLPQPPAPLDVSGPTTPAPSETHVYVPGTWVYRERYVWRPGFWVEYRPGWVWVSAHYRWTPAGYVFIDGYWDYPLAERGILFAPCYIPPVVYTAPAFVYTPTYVVREDCLFGAFFCRRGFGAYYFGDYFAPSYVSLGFTAWCGHVGVSLSFGRGGWYDPLFAYYRCGYRHDPYWRAGVYDLYAGRYRGDYLRPPVNLVQQTTVINNITNVKNVTNVNTNNVTMLTSLTNADRSGQQKLRQVPEAERKQQQLGARSTRDFAAKRAEGEAQLATRPGAGGKTAAPAALKLDLPPAPKGIARPTGSDPGISGSTVSPPAPPAPRPAPLGKANSKPALSGAPKLSDPGEAGATVIPKGNLKPPVAPKAGTSLPKGDLPGPSGAGALPQVNIPPAKSGVTIPPPPAPKLEAPTPKASGPAVTIPSGVKPPASTPPVTIPKPAPTGPALPKLSAGPVVPQPAPQAVPRTGPPVVPKVGPTPPPVSRHSPPPARPTPSKTDRKK